MPKSPDAQNLARSLNELLILSVLREGPRHGYQIALEVEDRSAGFFSFNHGTLYPILHNLEKQGFIDGQWEAGEGRRKRREYALTGSGGTHLAERWAEWAHLWERLSATVGDAGEPVRTGAPTART